MPFILRKVNRAKWFPGAGEDSRSDDEVAAEDFSDPDNEISVWEIDDEQSNLRRVIAAIASARDYWKHVDYVLFNPALARSAGIEIIPKIGTTKDGGANAVWHRDLNHPSREAILALVASIRAQNPVSPAVRVRREEVLQYLKDSVENGWISANTLSQELQQKLAST